jgi:hypothetical protein
LKLDTPNFGSQLAKAKKEKKEKPWTWKLFSAPQMAPFFEVITKRSIGLRKVGSHCQNN